MTFVQMQAQVRRRLDEAGSEFVSDQDIKDSLNEGLAEIADFAEYEERYANVRMLTGRTYYDLRTVLPDTFLSPRRAYSPNTTRWLEPTDVRSLDYHKFVQWELTYGPPQDYVMRGNWWLGTFPRPSDDKQVARFYYTAIPAPMVNDTDVPAFPEDFHDGLVDYAEYDLLAQQRETAKALLRFSDFGEMAVALKGFVDGRQSLPELPIL